MSEVVLNYSGYYLELLFSSPLYLLIDAPITIGGGPIFPHYLPSPPSNYSAPFPFYSSCSYQLGLDSGACTYYCVFFRFYYYLLPD